MNAMTVRTVYSRRRRRLAALAGTAVAAATLETAFAPQPRNPWHHLSSKGMS